MVHSLELSAEENECGVAGQSQIWSGEHRHLTAWGRFTVKAYGVTPYLDTVEEVSYKALLIWVWVNGAQERVARPWTPKIEVQT